VLLIALPCQTDWQTIKGILETLANKPTNPELQTSTMFWSKAGQGSVTLTGDEVQQFGEIIRELMKDDATFDNLTMKELENLMQDAILQILKAPRIQRRNEINKQVVELKKHLKEGVKRWTFIIPVTNLTLERKQLKIGNVRLFHFTDIYVNRWDSMSYNATTRYSSETRKKHREEFRRYVLKPLKGSVCAEVMVNAKHSRALEVALQEVQNALRAIMVFFVGNEDSRRSYIGVKGDIMEQSQRHILSVSSDKITSFQNQLTGTLYELKLDKSRINWMLKNGFKKISVLLAKQKVNSFESRLKTAIYWLGSAMNVPITHSQEEMDVRISLAREEKTKGKKGLKDFEFHDVGDRLIKLMVALESLVILDQREPIASNLSERTAFLVAKTTKDRMFVNSQIKKLYRLRSQAVHHGRIEITYSELSWLSLVVQAAILRLISGKNRLGISNDEEFRDWLVRMKFS